MGRAGWRTRFDRNLALIMPLLPCGRTTLPQIHRVCAHVRGQG